MIDFVELFLKLIALKVIYHLSPTSTKTAIIKIQQNPSEHPTAYFRHSPNYEAHQIELNLVLTPWSYDSPTVPTTEPNIEGVHMGTFQFSILFCIYPLKVLHKMFHPAMTSTSIHSTKALFVKPRSPISPEPIRQLITYLRH